MAKIKVDQVKCIGCGLCVSIAEEVFKIGDQGKAETIEGFEEKSHEEKIKEAATSCPVKAIAASK